MSAVKVLQIGLSSFPGGVENAIMNYFRFMDKNKVHFDFVCTESSLAYSEEIEISKSRIYYLESPKTNPIKYLNDLTNLIKDKEYDVVHINMLSAANIVPLIAAKKANVKKIIIHSHNSSLPSGRLRKMLHYFNRPFLSLYTSRYMACSKAASEWMFGDKNSDNVYILKNAIDADRFDFNIQQRKKLREQYKIHDDAVVIGHVGRFAEEKNHSFLIDCFYALQNELPNSYLLLVGDGILKEEICLKIAEYKLEEKVIMTGNVNDTSKYYMMMDVFCMPSKFEGLGIVAIEAQASGLPCILSTGVPKSAVVLDSSERISLDETNQWVKAIVEKSSQARNYDAKPAIQVSGYDVHSEVEKLEKYYLS